MMNAAAIIDKLNMAQGFVDLLDLLRAA